MKRGRKSKLLRPSSHIRSVAVDRPLERPADAHLDVVELQLDRVVRDLAWRQPLVARLREP